jgi:hypothetical protein
VGILVPLLRIGNCPTLIFYTNSTAGQSRTKQILNYKKMKKKSLLLTAVATLGLTAATMAQNVPSYVPTNGLVGWWPFNGNANDESGNGNNGTVVGAALTVDRFLNSNAAYDLSSISDKISLFSGFTNLTNNRTISFWFNSIPTSQEQKILSYRPSCLGGSENFFEFNLLANASTIQYYHGGGGILTTSYISNAWNNAIITINNGSANFYVNGILAGNIPSVSAMNQSGEFGLSAVNTCISNFGGPVQFTGKADDIGLWNRALSECEIQNLYNAQLNSAIGISAGTDQTVCEGDQVTLVGAGGSNYQWNNGVSEGVSFTAIASQEYIVIGEDGNGCIGTDTVQIIVNSHTTGNQSETALDSYTWPVNNQTYAQSGTYTAVIPNSAGCDSKITLDLTLSFTGIDEQENSKIIISPNPASEYFMIIAPDELIGESYSILDLNGKTLQEGTLTQKEQKIDIGNLSEGTYMFKINNETEQTFRIIKN